MRNAHPLVAVALAIVVSMAFLTFDTEAMSWTIEDVDPGGLVANGRLALSSFGAPHVLYWDFGNLSLIYAERVGMNWERKTLRGPLASIAGADLALDGMDRPHVVYWDNATTEIWHFVREGTNWAEELVGSAEDGGGTRLALALDNLSRPHMVYQDGPVGSMLVRYTYWNGSAWLNETIDAGMNFGGQVDLALHADGVAHVLYATNTDGSPWEELRYARSNGTAWDVEVVASKYSIGVGSIELDWAGTPRVSFAEFDGGSNFQLKYAWREFAGSWPSEVVDTNVATSALALDPTGRPYILYRVRLTNELRLASWNDTAWQTESIMTPPGGLELSDIEVDWRGNVHVTFDVELGVLKYAIGSPPAPHPRSWIADVSPYWRTTAPLNLVAWVEPPTGATVDLHYRFDGGSGWGPWTFFASDSTGPWMWAFPFPDGEGRYEFYSIAFDGREWELQPPLADTAAGYDTTPPVSSASPISPYWWDTPSLPVQATATDALSGVAQVTLLSRYAPDNVTWTSWTPFAADSSPPWSWVFPFSAGEGNYEFYTLAMDVAGNAEGTKTTAEARAGYRAPFPPPRQVTTVWDGGTGIGLVWEQPGGVAPDVYLVYRAADPTGFADLSPATAYATVNAPATAWTDPEPLIPPEERYYLMRAVYSNGTTVSATSNTAGVFAGALNAGLTAISRPLGYFPWVDYSGLELDTVGEYRTAFAASRIEYLDAAGTWQRVFGGGDPNTVLEVGRAYVVARANPGRFVFTGLPGAQIAYTDAPGFDPSTDARELQVAVSGDDVLLTFPKPPAVTPGVDAYEVLVATNRVGFFDGSAVLLGGAAVPAGPGPTMTLTDAGAILRSPELYYMVVPVTAAGVGASTYSVGVFTRTFQDADTLALPLRPATAETVDAYADAVPNTLGLLYLSGGAWVPHSRAMPAGVYDAALVFGAGYQITVAAASRYSFVGP